MIKDIKLLPLWVCIIAGCVALCGNYYNGTQLLKIEKKQFESNLILKSIRPENGYQVNAGTLFSAQIVDQQNKPLRDAKVSIFKHRTDDKAYAVSTSDVNGLFKVPYPDEKWIKVLITREGYRSFAKLYMGRTLNSVRLIPLEKLK